MILEYLGSLDPFTLVRALPGNVAQGLIWGIMALGVYITFRILDFADLTVDGSLATGGAVAVMLIQGGMNPALALLFAFLAGLLAGLVTGLLHTKLGIPGILASILTQISLYSINLNIMGCSNQAVSVGPFRLAVQILGCQRSCHKQKKRCHCHKCNNLNYNMHFCQRQESGNQRTHCKPNGCQSQCGNLNDN